MENVVVQKLLAKIFKYLNLEKNSDGEWFKGEEIEENLEVKILNMINEDHTEKDKMASELLGGTDVRTERKKMPETDEEKRIAKLQFLQAPDIIKKKISIPQSLKQMNKDAKNVYGPSRPNIDSESLKATSNKLMTGVSIFSKLTR